MFSLASGLARTALALVLCGVGATSLRAQGADDALSAKFKQAADLYFRGHADEALKLLQAILAENPTQKQAFQLYDEASKEVMWLMLEKGGEFETTAKRFLQLASVGRKEKTDDAAAIQALVEKAMTGNYLEKRDAVNALSANHGEYGAAPFIPFLGDDDEGRRVAASTSITKLSGDAVLPLLAALECGDDRIVRNAASCLSLIGDSRAVPGLKSVWEKSTNDVSKSAANDALKAITGKGAAALSSAAELHVAAARSYFRDDSTVVKPFDTKDAVWSCEGKAVVAKKVPTALRSLKLAEQHCMAALEHPRAQAILLATYAAEKATVAAGKAGGADAGEPDPSLDVALAAGGADALSAALAFAMENDAPLAGVELLRALEAAGAATDAMRAALGSGYKSVRYAAALALASAGDASPNVVKVLGDALSEHALHTVLVVDDKSESRNAMASVLSTAGYSAIVADNGAIGFARARTLPPKDVILVRAGMPDITLDQFVYDNDFRAASSAIVVVADAKSIDGIKALYDGKGRVKGFLADPVTNDALVAAVKAATTDLDSERAAANAASERAAAAISKLPRSALAPISDALTQALSRPEETVVGPVLQAVARLGPTNAAPAVAAIFADASKSEALRVAAADALGGIFAYMSQAPADDILQPLVVATTKDASAKVREAAARALGRAAFFKDADRARILRGQRSS